MEEKTTIYYDEECDFLEITSGDLSNTYSKNRGNGVFEIIDEKTGKVKGISISQFTSKTKGLKTISIPLSCEILS